MPHTSEAGDDLNVPQAFAKTPRDTAQCDTTAPACPATLVLDNISKRFGDSQILNRVSLRLDKGRVHTLTGGNGSGKTTLFNIITGFLKPTGGDIYFKGQKLARATPPHRINRLGIGRTFQDLRLAMQMTALENILLALEKKLFSRPTPAQHARAAEILEKVSLAEKRDTLAGELSYGQQKLLTIGCCIANNAELLLIDEAVAGIDAANQEKIINMVKRLKNEGKTILQIEHNTDYIRATSDRVFQMEKGVIAC